MRKTVNIFIFYVNILAAVSLLVAYVAPFINPARLLFPAFFGLSYPYLLFLNVIFIIYWIIKFKKEFFISFIAILIGWSHLMNFMPMRFSNQSDDHVENVNKAPSLKIMSYNVRTFDQFQWSKNKNSKKGIFQIIRNESPDIVCLQEFYTKNNPGHRETDIAKELVDYNYKTIYYSKKSGPNTGIGIATYSKYPIIKTSRIPFNETTNQAVYTDIQFNSDTIRIFNIHLQSIRLAKNNYSFIDTMSLKYSNEQMREVRDIGLKLKDAFVRRSEQSVIIHRYIESSPYPVIVAGDFNDTPVSFAYNTIKKGLNDAFRETGKGFGNTYAGDLPSFRIDFILFSKELDALEFNRIKSMNSDHFPIIANLMIRLTGKESQQ